jgi:predicted ATPase
MIAQALGVPEKSGGALVASLAAHLRRRQLLLLLDNCEQVRDDCAALSAALLQAASGLTIVATSREPLQIAGERIYALSPLSLPQADADAAAIERSEAVQLFVERAERQQRDFALTPARAPVIAELCRHLDGIPLALELAAARVRSLSVEQILARIGDRFRLLASSAPPVVPRHQTLRATLDWSFDLLAGDERTVLRRIAVFAGGFTLDAAAAVAGDAALDEYAIVDVLARLVARSLVSADTSEPGARYRLLETTRAYALERLAEAGEAERLGRARASRMRRLRARRR